MTPDDHYRTLRVYDHWANRAIHDHLTRLPAVAPHAWVLLDHIIGVEWLWYTRVRGEPRRMDVWPTLSVLERPEALTAVAAEWRAQWDALRDAGFDRGITYVNSKGESWKSSVAEIITQLSTHGAYHRGQIATTLGASGQPNAYTDFVHATRQGLIEI